VITTVRDRALQEAARCRLTLTTSKKQEGGLHRLSRWEKGQVVRIVFDQVQATYLSNLGNLCHLST
jgi:hypothetical protein